MSTEMSINDKAIAVAENMGKVFLAGVRNGVGVYVGGGSMPNDCVLQIDTDEEVINFIDCVVETGTPTVVAANLYGETIEVEHTFKYRKWSSGMLEVYGKFTSQSITWQKTSSGDMTFYAGFCTHPILNFKNGNNNLFNATPECAVVGNCADLGEILGVKCVAESGGFYGCGVQLTCLSLIPRTAPSNYTDVSIYVSGTWK